MHIVTYDEVERKDELFPLFHRAFGHSFDPWRFEEKRREDLLFRDGPVAFCAMVDGTLAGIVGAIEVPTRTLEGEETVGGVWTVATHPTFTRQGIATALMQRAHQYFRERGIRLAFLGTARSLVAHGFYRRLGYEEVEWTATRPMAYKVISPDKRERTTELQSATEEHVATLFQRFTAERTGFVLRPDNFLGLCISHGELKQALCLETGGGYVLAGERRGGIDIRELVALDVEAQHTLLAALEGQGSSVADRLVTSETLLEGYRERGYLFTQGTYEVFMAKALEPEVSVGRLYGDAFYISLTPL